MLGWIARFYQVLHEKGGRYVARASITRLYWFFAGLAIVDSVSQELERNTSSARSLKELVDSTLAFRNRGIAIAPNQIKSEIVSLLETVKQQNPRTIVEIGTAQGGTIFLFSHVAADDARLITVDMPSPPFGSGYLPYRARLYRMFARKEQEVVLIRSDSHQKKSLAMVGSALSGSSIDFLFIDGDHSYEGVKKDFEMYSPLVRKGGLVAFHDIVPGRPEDVGGVPDFWKEVKASHSNKEFVNDYSQKSSGIGVLFL